MKHRLQTGRAVRTTRRVARLVSACTLVLLATGVAGCRETVMTPYSEFKAHITAGDVTEVRFGGDRLEAVSSERARAAGGPGRSRSRSHWRS
jgi:hypothetical protein